MLLPELCQLDATGQAALIHQGKLSPQELLEHTLACITVLNPALNAVVTPMVDEARAQVDAGLPDGPLRGVPLLLKDTTSYAGVRLTSGSALFAHYVPRHDSELVRRYRQAGLVMVGKTNLPEFGIQPTTEPRLFGACRNPWDTGRSPGGSSGGAAAAVAAGMVALAHGSDGGGSLRIPASCCGLFGLKPTRGRVPFGPGASEPVSGFVVAHALTRSVRDSAALLDISAGPDVGIHCPAPSPARPFVDEVGQPPGRLRIAWSARPPGGGLVHPDCVAAVEEAATLCEELGQDVYERALDLDVAALYDTFLTLWAVGCTVALAALLYDQGKEPPADTLEPLTLALFEHARRTPAPVYELARLHVQRLARQIGQFFEPIDVWLSPALAEPPAPLGTFTPSPDNPLQAFWRGFDYTPFTALANLTGQPAAVLPLSWNAEGLPIGVQFVGHYGDEATLLRLASQLEQARPWAQRRPPLHCANMPPA